MKNETNFRMTCLETIAENVVSNCKLEDLVLPQLLELKDLFRKMSNDKFNLFYNKYMENDALRVFLTNQEFSFVKQIIMASITEEIDWQEYTTEVDIANL